MSSDGSLIVTEYLIYVPDEENPLTPGAQASAADMLCAYSADGTLLFEVMAGSCSIADIEMEPNIPFLHARGDIDRMMIGKNQCPQFQVI